jgi:hypothetical protein
MTRKEAPSLPSPWREERGRGTKTRGWAVLLLVLFTGCTVERDEQSKPPVEPTVSAPLTAEQARTALKEMLKRRDSHVGWLFHLASDLEGPIEKQDDGTISIGRWVCNLDEKWFERGLSQPL